MCIYVWQSLHFKEDSVFFWLDFGWIYIYLVCVQHFKLVLWLTKLIIFYSINNTVWGINRLLESPHQFIIIIWNTRLQSWSMFLVFHQFSADQKQKKSINMQWNRAGCHLQWHFSGGLSQKPSRDINQIKKKNIQITSQNHFKRTKTMPKKIPTQKQLFSLNLKFFENYHSLIEISLEFMWLFFRKTCKIHSI